MVSLFLIKFLLLATPIFAFTYTDLTSWGTVCTTGFRQSPIDIQGTRDCDSYKVNLIFFNNDIINSPDSHHALQNLYPGGKVNSYDGRHGIMIYNSVQYHWHSPSEHKINGKQYDAELHLVHQLDNLIYGSQRYAVIGLLFEIDNTVTSDIISSLSVDGANNKVNIYTVLNSELASKSFYNYLGSLTTPPCSEFVNWYVCTNIFKITQDSYNKLRSGINAYTSTTTGNARPTQDINGRTVRLLTNQCNQNLKFSNIMLIQ